MRPGSIGQQTCDEIRRWARRGFTTQNIRKKLSCDPTLWTIRYHARGLCSHSGDEPPIPKQPPETRKDDPLVPAIKTSKNYNA